MENMKTSEFIVWLLCLVGAVLSGFWIFRTYTADSEIIGNIQQTSSNLVFIIQSETVVMQQDQENTDKYYTSKKFSSVYQVDTTFDAEKYDYEFILNDRCFASTKFENGLLECNLETTFVNTNGQDLFTDTLYITINFYSGSTVLDMYTLGGATANAYWLSYFNSYGFDMRVYKL